jgi:hypothetical protein
LPSRQGCGEEVGGRRVAKSAKVGGLEICKYLGIRPKAAKSAKKSEWGGQRSEVRGRGGECGGVGECGEASRRIAGDRVGLPRAMGGSPPFSLYGSPHTNRAWDKIVAHFNYFP